MAGLAGYYDLMLRLSARDGASSVLMRVEQKLSALHKAASPAVKGMSDRLATFGLATQEVLHATEALTSMTQPFLKFEDSLADVASMTGLVGKQLENVGKAARRGAMDFGTSADEQAKMYTRLISKFSPDPYMGEQGAKFLAANAETVNKLAAIANMSRDDMADAVADMTLQMGVNFRDGEELTRKIAEYGHTLAASQKEGASTIRQLQFALGQVGGTANLAGIQFDQLNAHLQTLALRGRTGAEAGVGLRNVMLRMLAPRRGGGKVGFEMLGVNPAEIGKMIDDPAQGLSAALKMMQGKLSKFTDSAQIAILGRIFGVENVESALYLINLTDQYDIFLDRIRKSTADKELDRAASVRMNTTLHHTEQAIARINNKLISFGQKIGSTGVMFMNVLEHFSPQILALAALKFLMPAHVFAKASVGFSAVSHAAIAASGTVHAAAFRMSAALHRVSVAGIIAAARLRAANIGAAIASGGAAVARFVAHQMTAIRLSYLFQGGLLGMVRGGLLRLVGGLGSAARAIWAFNATLLASPVLWVVGALAGAAFLLYKNWDRVSAYLRGVWEGLIVYTKPIQEAWQGFLTAIEPVTSALAKFFAPAHASSNELVNAANAGQRFAEGLAAFLNLVVPPFIKFVSVIASGVGMFFGLSETATNAGAIVNSALTIMFTPLKVGWGLLSRLWQFFQDLGAMSLKDAGWNLMQSFWEGITSWFSTITSGFAALRNEIVNVMTKGEVINQSKLAALQGKSPLKKDAVKDAAVDPLRLKAGLARAEEIKMQGYNLGKGTKESIEQGLSGELGEKLHLKPLRKALKADFSWIAEQNKGLATITPRVPPMRTLPEPVPSTGSTRQSERQGRGGVWSEGMPEIQAPSPFALGGSLPKDLRFPDLGGSTTSYRFPDIGQRNFPIPFPQLPTITLPDMSRMMPQAPSLPSLPMPQLQGTPALEAPPAAIAPIRPQTQSQSGVVTVNFSVTIQTGATSGSPKELSLEVEQALRRLGPDLARVVDDAVKQSQRLSFAGF